jgi:hypothetical protein
VADFHSFRYSYVQRAHDAEVSPAVLQTIIGWSSPAMEKIYTRIPEKSLKDAGERIAANGVNHNEGGGGTTSDLSGMSDGTKGNAVEIGSRHFGCCAPMKVALQALSPSSHILVHSEIHSPAPPSPYSRSTPQVIVRNDVASYRNKSLCGPGATKRSTSQVV